MERFIYLSILEIIMKAFLAITAFAVVLTGCNAVATTADKMMNKQSSFSQKANTVYPTVDGKKDSQPADFGKQKF